MKNEKLNEKERDWNVIKVIYHSIDYIYGLFIYLFKSIL